MKLEEFWWNLGAEPWRNLLAAQDGFAPENHREPESKSAPKPSLWLKTPKLVLLGQNERPESYDVKSTDGLIDWDSLDLDWVCTEYPN